MTAEVAQASELDLIPFPWLPRPAASGLYVWRLALPAPTIPTIPVPPVGPVPSVDETAAAAILPAIFRSEELRLDVDGRYPQMTVSGTVFSILPSWRVHWIARLTPTAPNTWTGPIWYKDGSVSSFAHTSVLVQAHRSFFPAMQSVTVTFYTGAAKSLVRIYRYSSAYFHPVELEYDCAEGTTAVTSFQTDSHPNRPATLPAENLSIETVFRRAGFNATVSSGASIVPISLAGANNRWSDAEMHDAMQAYWSRFANKPQWAFWAFFAALHEMGSSLGGIMFDSIGPNERQGTAIFEDSFISSPPAGDPAPAAWVQRMRLWTAVHESGHTFNLAHSWQKSMGTPWIPLANEPEARSFMNYPYYVSGGAPAFFNDFAYRFSDQELLFLRHAPLRFVQQGNAAWFDHHGFEEGDPPGQAELELELRVNRAAPVFEFMEPVVIELKLKNVSTQPKLLGENVLLDADQMVVVIKKQGQGARQFLPYARLCLQPSVRVLMPGEASYESLFLSAGVGGWNISEPGDYLIQAMLQIDDANLVSNQLRVRVQPASSRDEEFLAQDFFTDDVGRILAFDGSKVFTSGNETLRGVVERMGERKAAVHAAVALAMPLMSRYKLLALGARAAAPTAAAAAETAVSVQPADIVEGRRLMEFALMGRPGDSAESLGHIDYRYYADRMSDALANAGDAAAAANTQATLHSTLASRGVLASVLAEIESKRESYPR